MTLILLIGVWLAWQVNRARNVKQSISIVTQAGGRVHFDGNTAVSSQRKYPLWMRQFLGDEYLFSVVKVEIFDGRKWNEQATLALGSFPQIQELNITDVHVNDETIKIISNLNDLRSINIARAYISDDGIVQLKKLPKLRRLKLWASEITGYRLGEFAVLKNLQSLDLADSPLSDDGVNELAKLNNLTRLNIKHERNDCQGRCFLPFNTWTKLQYLELNGVQLSTEDWRNLARLTSLEELVLFNNGVEDGHLVYLRGLKNLKRLEISFSSVTASAVVELQMHLPSTKIEVSTIP